MNQSQKLTPEKSVADLDTYIMSLGSDASAGTEYRVILNFIAPPRSIRAELRHEIFHSRSDRISMRSSAPRFERQIPFYFEITKGR